MNEFASILILSGIVYSIVNYLKAPILKARPTWGEYLVYVQFAFAGIVTFAADVNALSDITTNVILGRILTALIAGGGSELIYSVQKSLRSSGAAVAVENVGTVEEVLIADESPPAYSGVYRST